MKKPVTMVEVLAATCITNPNKGILLLVNMNKNGKPVTMVEVFVTS